ncbi:hypothetical protein [Serratia marcescens]|uniref:hypothetical protein n=1 Tax=Serratia marcescens TaxID=615 RepID=UPI002469AEB7|nr:hypothetical protein [Serratia marcescens]WGL77915.1 hypothetical protein QFB82_01570 [Serratia marcescens]
MMDNKLSELSKPVAWTDAEELRDLSKHRCAYMFIIDPENPYHDPRRQQMLYSQEYVSALLARIAELEAIRADAAQVFKEIGTELGCNPDNESIMMAIDDLKATQMTGPLKDVLKRNIELEKRLATPVRLPRPACTYADHSYPAYSRKQVEEIITSAGMRFTVEGDE